jgi:acyl-CoA thioester hydrolase
MRHQVEWGETDAAGIVFYPNFFRWFDRGAHALFRSVGYPVSRIQQEGYAIPIIEAWGHFHRPLIYDDEIEIVSRVAELRTRAFRVEHRVVQHGEIMCSGYEVRIWGRLDPESRLRPERIPDELRDRIRVLEWSDS